MNSWRQRISKGFLVRLAGTAAAILLTLYLLSRQGWQEIGQAAARIEPWRFVLAFGLVILSRLFVTARWYNLLRSVGEEVTLGKGLRLTFAGLFSSNFLPTTVGGDAVRLAGAILYGISGVSAAASLAVDRLVGMVGYLLLLPFGILQVLQVNPGGLARDTQLEVRLAVSLLAPLGKWLRLAWSKIRDLIKRLLEALSLWFRKPMSLLISLLFTLLHMASLFSALYLMLTGMGEDISLWLLAALWSLIYFITLIPISINGLGVQEASAALILSTFGGVAEQNGLTLALLVRTLMMLASLPGAIFLPSFLPAAREYEKMPAEHDFE